MSCARTIRPRFNTSALLHVPINFPRFPSPLLFYYLSKAIFMNEVFIISYLVSINALFTVRWTFNVLVRPAVNSTQRHFNRIEQSTLCFLETPATKKKCAFWRCETKKRPSHCDSVHDTRDAVSCSASFHFMHRSFVFIKTPFSLCLDSDRLLFCSLTLFPQSPLFTTSMQTMIAPVHEFSFFLASRRQWCQKWCCWCFEEHSVVICD